MPSPLASPLDPAAASPMGPQNNSGIGSGPPVFPIESRDYAKQPASFGEKALATAKMIAEPTAEVVRAGYRALTQPASQQLPHNVEAYTDNPQHYDYAGAQAAGVKPDARGHWPDTYKTPTHITFSDESKYNDGGAGHWKQISGDHWEFTPGPTNLKYHSIQELQDYFQKYEPESTLILPGK